MDSISIIGIFLSFFLSILLFTKKGKTTSDNLLAIWLIAIGIYLGNYYVYLLGYWEVYPNLVGILHPFPLLFGPFLYLYVTFSLRRDQHLQTKDMLHFLPLVILYLS